MTVSGSTCLDPQDPQGPLVVLGHQRPPTAKAQVSLALQVLQVLLVLQETHQMTSPTESSATFKVKVLDPQDPPGPQEQCLLMTSSLSCSEMM